MPIPKLLQVLKDGEVSASRSILAALTIALCDSKMNKCLHLQTYRILEVIRPAPWDSNLRSTIPLTDDEIKEVLACIQAIKRFGVSWRLHIRRTA